MISYYALIEKKEYEIPPIGRSHTWDKIQWTLSEDGLEDPNAKIVTVDWQTSTEYPQLPFGTLNYNNQQYNILSYMNDNDVFIVYTAVPPDPLKMLLTIFIIAGIFTIIAYLIYG